MKMSSAVVTEPEAAKYIGMSIAWLRQCRMQGRGPVYMRMGGGAVGSDEKGRAIRYRLADLDAYLDAHRVPTKAEK